jgi:hypothetical protein
MKALDGDEKQLSSKSLTEQMQTINLTVNANPPLKVQALCESGPCYGTYCLKHGACPLKHRNTAHIHTVTLLDSRIAIYDEFKLASLR